MLNNNISKPTDCDIVQPVHGPAITLCYKICAWSIMVNKFPDVDLREEPR